MATEQRDTRPDGIEEGADRSAPSIKEQADSVLSGQATTVDTGVNQREEEDSEQVEQPKKAAKSTRSKSTDSK